MAQEEKTRVARCLPRLWMFLRLSAHPLLAWVMTLYASAAIGATGLIAPEKVCAWRKRMPAAGLDAWHAWQIARYLRQRSPGRPSLRLFPTRARAAMKKQPPEVLQGWPQSHLYLCQEALCRLLLPLLPPPLLLSLLLLDLGQSSRWGEALAWNLAWWLGSRSFVVVA